MVMFKWRSGIEYRVASPFTGYYFAKGKISEILSSIYSSNLPKYKKKDLTVSYKLTDELSDPNCRKN